MAEQHDEACQALNNYFKPRKNTLFEIFKFRKTNQSSDETLDQYHIRLVQEARYCEFTNIDGEIKAQIELGTAAKICFSTSKTDITELSDYGHTLETAEEDASKIEKHRHETSSENINALQRNLSIATPKRTCFYCGLS